MHYRTSLESSHRGEFIYGNFRSLIKGCVEILTEEQNSESLSSRDLSMLAVFESSQYVVFVTKLEVGMKLCASNRRYL